MNLITLSAYGIADLHTDAHRISLAIKAQLYQEMTASAVKRRAAQKSFVVRFISTAATEEINILCMSVALEAQLIGKVRVQVLVLEQRLNGVHCTTPDSVDERRVAILHGVVS